MRDLTIFSTRMIVGLLAMVFAAQSALAQSKPSSCVAELQKEYGTAAGLSADCPTKSDCTFQAPTGNASARALIETIAKRAESCFTGAGLKVAKEETLALGTTRLFDGDGEAKCAVLVSTPNGSPPEGVRAVCQPK